MAEKDYILEILTRLNEKGVKTGYDKLKKMVEKDPATVDLVLDISGTEGKTKAKVKQLASELHNELSKAIKLEKLEFDIDVKDLEKAISSVIKQTEKMEKEIGKAKSNAEKFLSQFDNKTQSKLVNSKEYQDVRNAIDNLGNTGDFDGLTKKINQLDTTYNRIVSNLREGSKSLNPYVNAITEINNMDNTIKSLELDFKSLSNQPEELSNKISELYKKAEAIKLLKNDPIEWSKAYGDLKSSIVDTKGEIKNLSKAQKASGTDVSKQLEYYNNIKKEVNTLYSLKTRLVTAGKAETVELNKQIKSTQQRIKYNEKQINKKSLKDDSLTREINDLEVAKQKQLALTAARLQDKESNKILNQEELQRKRLIKKTEQQIENVKELQKAGKIETQVVSATVSYEKLNNLHVLNESIKNDFSQLKILYDAIGKSSTDEELLDNYDKFNIQLQKVNNSMKQIDLTSKGTKSKLTDIEKVTFTNQINAWRKLNSAASKEFGATLDELISDLDIIDKKTFNQRFKLIKSEASTKGLLGRNLSDTLSNNFQKFGEWAFTSSIFMNGIQNIKNAASELKEVNTILTEISKTSERTTQELKKLGDASFDVASVYGRKASNYLTGIQEMSRSGYDNSEELSELSILAQSAGNMTDELANKYIIATDKAYKLHGEVNELNKVLDGQNYITNKNALSLSDLANATMITASQASSSSVAVDEMSSAIGTMIAVTQQGGDIAGRAFKGILMNLQQVSGTVSEETGEVIGLEDLTKYEDACNALGVSLKEVKDGIVSLRNPMQILKELSQAYTALDKTDSRRANLINAVGGKYRGNQLNALLENWDLYEKMMSQYSAGTGFAMEEAMKSANNWEGSLNRLSNTWTSIVNNFADSDGIILGINSLNNLLSVVGNLTKEMSSLELIGALGGLILNKTGSGKHHMFSGTMYCAPLYNVA